MTDYISTLDRQGLAQSLWAATAVAAPDCPPLEGHVSTDIAVIGAGFAGLSTALHLAEKGVSVTVLEAAEPGFGASGRNGGQVINGLKDGLDLVGKFGAAKAEQMQAFAARTADTVFDLVQRHGIDCDAGRGGWIQAAHSNRNAQDLLRKVEERAAQGANVTYLNGEETAEATGCDWYRGAFLDRECGTLQPLSYARGLAVAAQKAGATVHGQSPVLSLARVDGKWRVETPGGSVTADKIVLCTNGYSSLTDAAKSVERVVLPFFSYQIATAPLSDNLLKTLPAQGLGVSETRRVLSYSRIDAQGRFLMGARGRMDGELDESGFSFARRRLQELFPRLASQAIEFGWNGRVAITLDHLPRLVEPAPGLHAALGWNGRGVAMTSAMGPVMADWLTGTRAEELPMPVTKAKPIPFHSLRVPASRAMAYWYKLQDERERAAD